MNYYLYNVDARIEHLDKVDVQNSILVIDPPFDVQYKYNTYKDNLKENEYLDFIKTYTSSFDKFVIIHYPEMLFKIASHIGVMPTRCVQWVYIGIPREHKRRFPSFVVSLDFKK